jgi:hypothetical protein
MYIIPPLVFIAGAIILFKAFVTWKKPPPVTPGQDTESDPRDEYIQRIEEELRDM